MISIHGKDLGLAIQQGVKLTVGAVDSKFRPSDPTIADFKVTTKTTLPKSRSGTNREKQSLYFKDYAPFVFRRLRAMFGVDAADYLLSLCGETPLISQEGEGKSGAVFFFSPDKTYIVKSMTPKEAKYLVKILPLYYSHVLRHPHTLLTHYFGLHRIQSKNGRKIHLIVMNNVIDSSVRLDYKFDLKGSLFGRRVKNQKSGAAWKDLDFLELYHPLNIPRYMKEFLKAQLKIDSDFLASLGLLDYSLLLGVAQNTNDAQNEAIGAKVDAVDNVGPSINPAQHKIIQGKLPSVSTDSFARDRRMTARYALDSDFSADLLSQPTLFRPQNKSKTLQSVFQRHSGGILSTDEKLIYYVGIIDILTQWNAVKWMEHVVKVPFQGHDISAVEPHIYSKRFFDFMTQKILGFENDENQG